MDEECNEDSEEIHDFVLPRPIQGRYVAHYDDIANRWCVKITNDCQNLGYVYIMSTQHYYFTYAETVDAILALEERNSRAARTQRFAEE